MLAEIREKVRALVNDIGESQIESFTYTTSNIFKLCGNNVTAVTQVLVGGNALASGESYTLNGNEVTVDASLTAGDEVEITYTAYKYSDSELTEYVKASLVWISIFDDTSDEDFEIEDDEIYPTPTNKQEDLIALITSILIKPDYSKYQLPNLTVVYPRTMSKEERIELIITRFRRGIGALDVIEWDDPTLKDY